MSISLWNEGPLRVLQFSQSAMEIVMSRFVIANTRAINTRLDQIRVSYNGNGRKHLAENQQVRSSVVTKHHSQ